MIKSDNITNEFLKTLTDLVRQIDDNIIDVVYDFDENEIRAYYKTNVLDENENDFEETEYRNAVEVNDNCIHCPMCKYLRNEEYSAFDLVSDTLTGLFF